MTTRRWDVIARLCRKHGLARGAEIGVADGRFTAGLLSAAANVELLAVDYWPENYPTWDGLRWTRELQDQHRDAFLKVSGLFPGRLTLIEAPSVAASLHVADASLDFVFIDADHSFDAVMADIRAWLPKVREGGFITGHDYDRWRFPDVVRAVRACFSQIKTQEDFVWTVQA